ncbi:Uncharacterised protein [uncultured Clostridium sp.]|nr:Uncharacterised protein [uncultured Clostridium sp.]
MLHMKDQCRIKNPGFQICIFLVRSEHVKNVFRRRTVGIRTVDIHTAIQIIMVIRMIPVNSQHREDTDEIHRLTENIFHGIIRNLIIVGGQRQHALRHGIHDILTGRLHNDISGKLPERTRIFRVPDCGNGNASARRKGRCRKIWSRLFPEAVGNIFLVNICFRELGFSGPYRRKGRYRQFLFFFSLHDSVCLAESPYHLDLFLFHGLVCHTERH